MIQTKRGEKMKEDVGKRISELRRDRGYNQEELAEMARISRITLARYETGAIEPGAFALSRIADALSVSTDELLCRTEKMPPFIQVIKKAVPVVGEIACGTPITAEQNIEEYADLPDGIHADFALRCKGDSMEPTFKDGDFVLIRQQPSVENGQIAAVGINGEATLKHVYTQDDSGILLVANNPKYHPIQTDAEGVTIYGLAVGYTRIFQ
jgi:repressor LexA